MGRYYNPVQDVQTGKVGRFLAGHNHDFAVKQLKEGEHLYALCDRLIFKQVVCVDAKSEFDEFYRQYTAGYLISFELVALSEEEHRTT